MGEPIRLGFVGAGMMGQLAHLSNYVGLPDVELVALAEGRQELARRVADRYGVAEVVADHRALAERDDLDAVVAILHYSLNYGVACDLLAAGKHLATEKSLCLRATAADDLVRRAAEAGRVYQVSYMKRFDPGVEAAVEVLRRWRAEGTAGELRLARIWCASPADWTFGIERPLTSTEPIPPYKATPEPPQEGEAERLTWVSMWLNYYSHQTNLLRWLMGEDYTVAYHDSWSGGDVVVVHGASGARGLLELHRFRSAGWDEGFELTFENGTVRGRMPAPLARQQHAEIEIVRQDVPVTERPYQPPRWAMRAQAEAFVAAVRGGEQRSPASEAAKEIHLAWQLAETAWRENG